VLLSLSVKTQTRPVGFRIQYSIAKKFFKWYTEKNDM